MSAIEIPTCARNIRVFAPLIVLLKTRPEKVLNALGDILGSEKVLKTPRKSVKHAQSRGAKMAHSYLFDPQNWPGAASLNGRLFLLAIWPLSYSTPIDIVAHGCNAKMAC